MSEKQFFKVEYDEEWYLFDNNTISEELVKEQAEYGYGVFANSLSPSEVVELLNNQQDEIQQLKEKLQISEASLALLIDMILWGDVDELVKRVKECARQLAEQFDEFTKEELEEMITRGASL